MINFFVTSPEEMELIKEGLKRYEIYGGYTRRTCNFPGLEDIYEEDREKYGKKTALCFTGALVGYASPDSMGIFADSSLTEREIRRIYPNSFDTEKVCHFLNRLENFPS